MRRLFMAAMNMASMNAVGMLVRTLMQIDANDFCKWSGQGMNEGWCLFLNITSYVCAKPQSQTTFDAYTYTCRQFRITSKPSELVRLWEEARVPGENLHKHRENVQTQHIKARLVQMRIQTRQQSLPLHYQLVTIYLRNYKSQQTYSWDFMVLGVCGGNVALTEVRYTPVWVELTVLM